MSPTTDLSRGTAPLQDVDVLIVGAGSSGIGAARRLRLRTPASSYAIVEAGPSIDDTRAPFRYPGVRAAADHREIPAHIPDRASESGAEEHSASGIHFLRANWSGDPAHWVVTLQDCESGALATMSCSFLYLCSSHHRHAEDHTSAWPGLEDFAGAVLHRRYKSMRTATALHRFRPRYPTCARALLRKYGVKRLPKGSGHDRPSVQAYEPWDQHIGELIVHGAPVEVPHHVLYRGMMLDGVPNLVFAVGSGDAPWTVTADLVSDHVARLVAHMEERGYTAVTPRLSSRPTETSPVAEMFSGQFHRPGNALLSRGDRAPRRLRGRSGKGSAPFLGPVGAQELEFTPADA